MNEVNDNNETMKALVVDDEATNRLVLKKLLKRLNYEIIEAENGQEAVDIFQSESPDIVFMDVMMPVKNGYEATVDIKKLTADDFVPVIILTALTGPEEIQKSIEAGADDFLSKPFEMVTLNSKIRSLERIRRLYRHLQKLNEQLREDDRFARTVFNEAIFKKNDEVPAIKSWFEKSERFNNDLLLTSVTPSNGLNILFGHFNVEGTAAAVGALPTSETFRAMTQKGFAPHDIADAINKKLHQLLPPNIYLRGIFLSFNNEVNLLTYANFGMPQALTLSLPGKSIVRMYEAEDIYLGKDSDFNAEQYFKNVSINADEKIVLCRCDANEAEVSPEEFSLEDEFKKCVVKATDNMTIIDGLKLRFAERIKNLSVKKNISVIEIDCIESLTPDVEITESVEEKQIISSFEEFEPEDAVNLDLEIQNKNLLQIDPIPILLNFVSSVANIEKHQDSLFTIFTELYVNALDHGVLGLDSSLKSSPDGFFNYFKEKEERLKNIEQGSVRISISIAGNKGFNQLDVSITDSGPGFNYQEIVNDAHQAKNDYSGRGFLLLKNLCDIVEFNESGNSISVTYRWNQQNKIQ